MGYGLKRVFQTKLTDIASSDLEGVGERRIEGDDEYIWMKGVAVTIAGSIVQFDGDYATTLLTTTTATNYIRRLAIAKAAIVANKYGWYQIRGVGSVYAGAGCVAEVPLYTHATGGMVDDAATKHIYGLVLTATVGVAAAVTECIIFHPYSDNT